jgi:class 3 adenylate cyclase
LPRKIEWVVACLRPTQRYLGMTIATLELGRDAVRRHAWTEAVEGLTAADREQPLSPDDLELLGTAAWWAARPEEATEALERAFAGYDTAARTEDAARVAMTLAYEAFRRLANAVGSGWQARAERLLAELPQSSLQATGRMYRAVGLLMQGRYDEGLELADEAIALAREHGNADALYEAMGLKGMAHVLSGDWQTGVAELDEAAAAASAGKLNLRTASDILCMAIGACRNIGDLERAGQWADESERWMRRNGAGGFPGVCQVHRAELKMLHGHWAEAEQDARLACKELERFHLMDGVGFAYNAVGEIRLRMGDLDGATEAFDRAYEFGHDGQPGQSLALLARGEVADAQRAIARAIATASGTGKLSDRAGLGRLLPAQVAIAVAARDLETARQAVEQLESITAEFGRPLYRANALTARGELLLGEDKPSEASPILGEGWRLWQASDLPYEAARARFRYAEAVAAEGDTSTARRDLVAARAAFQRLGATLDLKLVDALLGAEGGAPAAVDDRDAAAGGRATRTFMFTDIVTSTDLVGLIGDDDWNELLGWHDREMRAAFAEHRGEVVNHTGDGFFAAFERATDALECAIDIQRRLVRHRREQGFAPSVRIGLHRAEATRRGRDYGGRGVHIAARVGAAADRDEILATAAVLQDVSSATIALSEPRELTLKGVREPVEVRAVNWR